MDKRFKRYTAPAGEREGEHAQDSVIHARVSDGQDDAVSTLGGVVNVGKGDVVVVRDDSPGQYDVIPADAWDGLDWTEASNGDSKPARKPASKTTARKR